MKPYLPAKFEVCGCYSYWVSLLQPDYEEEEEEEHEEFGENYFYEYYTHTTSNYIKFLIGVNFYGDLHLDVIRCWIKLKLKVKIGISLSMVE